MSAWTTPFSDPSLSAMASLKYPPYRKTSSSKLANWKALLALGQEAPGFGFISCHCKKGKERKLSLFFFVCFNNTSSCHYILRILGQIRTGGKYLIIIKVKHMKIVEIPALIVLHAEVENIRNKRWVLSF
jgi:hypothetical protein